MSGSDTGPAPMQTDDPEHKADTGAGSSGSSSQARNEGKRSGGSAGSGGSSSSSSAQASSSSSTEAKAETILTEFKLSCTLSGHSHPVRDIAAASDDLIVTAEERGMMHVWQRQRGNFFAKLDVLTEPVFKRLVFVCEYPKGAKGYPANTFIAGGGDSVARPFTAEGKLLEPIMGHSNSVNSISVTSKGEIITGSWDGTARVWRGTRCVREMAGHEHATEVLGLPSGEIVTGSVNKTINIFNGTTLVKSIPKAHDHAVRKLIAHPLGFASCGNDGYVKVWSLQGEQLLNIPAHIEDVKFLYGLALLPTGELVSSGEDGNIRIWKGDGQLQQQLELPGPVRSLKILPNGDILAACADRVGRIFTRNSSRVAGEKELKQFEELAQLVKASGLQALDTSKMQGESALQTPGKKDGEIRMINVPKRGAVVYKWSAGDRTWVEIGDAIGQPTKALGKTMLDGVAYDYVTDVFVTDTQKIKLGFNRDDDPYDVAHKFCTIWGLPDYVRQQVIEHITPMTDKNAYQARIAEEKKAAEATKLIHVPSWMKEGFQLFATVKLPQMKAKILEYNTALTEAKSEFAMDANDLKTFERLNVNLADVANFHVAPFTLDESKLIFKLLHWPADKNLPVLDCFRVLMCHLNANKTLMSDKAVVSLLLSHAKDGSTHISLVLKALSNWIGKRERAPSERASSPKIPDAVTELITEALDGCAEAASSEDENAALSYALFTHNLMCWFGRLKIEQSDFFLLVASALCELLNRDRQDKSLFYGFMTLGTIAIASPPARDQIKETFSEQLIKFAKKGLASSNQAVAQDVQRVYGLQL